jgi:hypothetical protein
MLEVILNESDCRFATRIFKAVKGFPTGLACGRTYAEIYLHMIERDASLNSRKCLLCISDDLQVPLTIVS